MKSRKEIILELTPLLDVILIMMFYILMQNSLASKQAQDQASEKVEQIEAQYQEQLSEAEKDKLSAIADKEIAESKRADVLDQLAAANARLEGESSFEEYALIVSITIANSEDGSRRLHVLYGDKDESFSYGWDDMNYASNALRNLIDTVMKEKTEDGPIFFTFCYDDDVIFRQDYELVQEILTNTMGEHVYIKYSEGGK